jgi:hypothetical protein
MAMTQEAAISNCRLEVIRDALMGCSGMGWSVATLPDQADSVCSSPHTTTNAAHQSS